MSDIVKKLRLRAVTLWYDRALLNTAADEIERLRAALRKIADGDEVILANGEPYPAPLRDRASQQIARADLGDQP